MIKEHLAPVVKVLGYNIHNAAALAIAGLGTLKDYVEVAMLVSVIFVNITLALLNLRKRSQEGKK